MRGIVEVNNVPNNPEKHIVATVCDCDLWYWGSWNDENKAKDVANEISGIVVERMDQEIKE